jgi:hypothetical protein
MRSLPNVRLSMSVVLIVISLLASMVAAPATLVAQSGAGTIRVAPTGSDGTGCGSAAAPCRTIQGGIRNSSSGGTVLVAQGTYTYDPNQTPCLNLGLTTAVVCVHNKNLTILGGYSVTNWDVPDPIHQPTIIDGEQAHRGILTWNIASLRVEGFTVQNGLSQGAASGSGYETVAYGGGMQAVGVSVILRNMIFRNNQAHGGNTASTYGGSAVGGGVSINGSDNGTVVYATLENVAFDGNQAVGGQGTQIGGVAIGGGLHLANIVFSGNHLTFTNNTAQGGPTSGSGYIAGRAYSDAQGGAAAIYTGSQGAFQSVVATGNRALGGDAPNGDAGGAFGGALYVEHAQLAMSDATIHGNLAQGGAGRNPTSGAAMAEGGAMQTDNSDITLQRAYVIANAARGGNGTINRGPVGGGGAAFTYFQNLNGRLDIENSIFADNRAEFGTTGQKTGGGGGGLWLQGVTATIKQTTIARNTVNDSWLYGPAVILIAPYYSGAPNTSATIAYSVISDHAGGEGAVHVQSGANGAAVLSLNAGLFNNNTPANTNANGYQPGVINGLSTMRSGSPDYVSPGAPQYDYHIKGSSAARDQATGSTSPTDIDGESRSLFAPADIGADEYLPIVLSVAPTAVTKLTLAWKTNQVLAATTHHYQVNVTPGAGAAPPAQGISINVGTATSFILSGLTIGKRYTIVVQARNASNGVIDTSNTVTGLAVNKFVYLPSIMR